MTGAHSAASSEHLHHESNILPVGDHLDLLSRQSLAKAYVPTHPSNGTVNVDPGRGAHRQTLSSKHDAAVNPFKRNGAIPRDSLLEAIKDLHTSAVAVSINKSDSNSNRVLGARPPAIDDAEKSLPSTLCQLRSGFCRLLY